MTNKWSKAYKCAVIFGIILILVGFFIRVPGDAYNYIIGASLVAGKISGTMTTKAIFFVGGAILLCFGMTLKMLQEKEKIVENTIFFNDEEEINEEDKADNVTTE